MIRSKFKVFDSRCRMPYTKKCERVFSVILICVFLYIIVKVFFLLSEVKPEMDVESVGSMVGLTAKGDHFMMNGKLFTVLSGAIHYFRVVPEYWRDRLLKLKALGLNTVETYIPWNLHEPYPGEFNFKGIADVVSFIKLAQSLGLYVIVRPGPYICAEWEFGGLPSWLLRDPDMEVRSFNSPYLRAVNDYFDTLLPLLVPLQYKNGGPIIAFQIENEYGHFGDSSSYMKHLLNLFQGHDLKELLFTSDGLYEIKKAILPSVLSTINFKSNAETKLRELKRIQPNRPLMVMEFWPGWFDHWGENHHVMKSETVVKVVREILSQGASISFYMLHGGTNFGFMNGANYNGNEEYLPTITSYDYDSPISENGAITPKFIQIHKLLKEFQHTFHGVKIPEKLHLPPEIEKSFYGRVEMTKYIGFNDIISLGREPIQSQSLLAMEDFKMKMRKSAGQAYGYTLYRSRISANTDTIQVINLRDYGMVFIDGDAKGVVQWPNFGGKFRVASLSKETKSRVLDIFVENCGRVNVGKQMIVEKKGILGDVKVNGVSQKNWEMFPFEFENEFVKKVLISNVWSEVPSAMKSQPALFMGIFTVREKPNDTFLDTQGWNKGIVFINGRHLGRYWKAGPQRTLYVPAPWLKKGQNTIMVFELHPQSAMKSVKLVKEHMLGPTEEHPSL